MSYREYNQEQTDIFGLDINARIPEHHLVRFVNDLIENMDLTKLHAQYSPEGSPAYNPKMMLKIIVYAYMNGIYTCRKIAKAVRENINFIWLTGDQQPDFRTINTFAWTRCKDVLAEVFCKVVLMAEEKGYLELDSCFIDGTTLRANAGKNSYIWKKSALRYQEQVKTRVDNLFCRIKKLNEEEQLQYGDQDLREVGAQLEFLNELNVEEAEPEEIAQAVEKAQSELQKAVDTLKTHLPSNAPAIKNINHLLSELNKIQKLDVPKLEKYDQQIEIIGKDRNSASKTDNDATFIRMKDSLLAPGYVSSISTSNQFVTAVHLYNVPREAVEYTTLMDIHYTSLGTYPKQVIGDAAYGISVNLDYTHKKKIVSYLKPPDYKRDYWDSLLPGFVYEETKDQWVCPNGKTLTLDNEEVVRANGPERTVKSYRCEDCQDCPFVQKCIPYKNKSGKNLVYDPYLSPLRQETVHNLQSKEGKKLMKKRCIEPEAVFASIKWNSKFSRFTVRSLSKCKNQLLLVLLGHNIQKFYNASMATMTGT